MLRPLRRGKEERAQKETAPPTHAVLPAAPGTQVAVEITAILANVPPIRAPILTIVMQIAHVLPTILLVCVQITGVRPTILDVAPKIATIAPKVLPVRLDRVLIPSLLCILEVLPVRDDVSPILTDIFRVTGDVPPVLADVPGVRGDIAPVLAEILGVLTHVATILAEVAHVLPHILGTGREGTEADARAGSADPQRSYCPSREALHGVPPDVFGRCSPRPLRSLDG